MTCTVTLGEQTANTSVDIYVYSFRLETSSKSLVSGNYMNISCLVTPDDVPGSLLRDLKLCNEKQNVVSIGKLK